MKTCIQRFIGFLVTNLRLELQYSLQGTLLIRRKYPLTRRNFFMFLKLGKNVYQGVVGVAVYESEIRFEKFVS